MVGSDQHCIANGIGNEENAAQRKRVQEYLPERSISLHDVAQIGTVDFKECAGFDCFGSDQGSTTREQVHVASEFPAIKNVEDSLALGGDTKYFDPATQYDEDAVVPVSPFQNDFVRFRIPLLAEPR
jgi:hypothetical protein